MWHMKTKELSHIGYCLAQQGGGGHPYSVALSRVWFLTLQITICVATGKMLMDNKAQLTGEA